MMLLAGLFGGCKKKTELPVIVFADRAVENALDTLAEQYQENHKNVVIKLEYDTTENLYDRIVVTGEPCDLYISEGEDKQELLRVKKLQVAGTLRTLAKKTDGGTEQTYYGAKLENRGIDIEQSEAVSDFLEYISHSDGARVFAENGFEAA